MKDLVGSKNIGNWVFLFNVSLKLLNTVARANLLWTKANLIPMQFLLPVIWREVENESYALFWNPLTISKRQISKIVPCFDVLWEESIRVKLFWVWVDQSVMVDCVNWNKNVLTFLDCVVSSRDCVVIICYSLQRYDRWMFAKGFF